MDVKMFGYELHNLVRRFQFGFPAEMVCTVPFHCGPEEYVCLCFGEDVGCDSAVRSIPPYKLKKLK
ncbi:MAG: hypothetical protein ACOX6U_02940 [Oscillospiraceae bacterium]|jgi:hypothetical protein